MKDVEYFIATASNDTQRQFELDFADIIEVYDTNETTLVTEDERTLVITWEDNYYKSYRVIYETEQMSYYVDREVVKKVINLLKSINIDGETMQYILERVGMRDQMLRQLVLTATMDDVLCLVETKNML